MKLKAQNLVSKMLKGPECKFIRNYFERFKRRHNISTKKIVGEAATVNKNISCKISGQTLEIRTYLSAMELRYFITLYLKRGKRENTCGWKVK